MLEFLTPHRRAKSVNHEDEDQPRASEERPLSLLLSDENTDESRYYRSASFQQALLEEHIKHSDTPAPEVPEKYVRRSLQVSHRGLASKSSPSLRLPSFEEEKETLPEQQGHQPASDVPGKGKDAIISPARVGTIGSVSAGSGGSEQPRKLNRRRSLFNGPSSLTLLARKWKDN